MAKLYCLFDTVAEEGTPIFEARNDAMARRIFENMKEFPVGATREDFRLIKLGSYFPGNEKDKPKIFGLSLSQDITKVDKYSDGELEQEELNEAV